MVEESEVDWDAFEVKKKLFKRDTKLKTRFFDILWTPFKKLWKIVYANHNYERGLWMGIVNEITTALAI